MFHMKNKNMCVFKKFIFRLSRLKGLMPRMVGSPSLLVSLQERTHSVFGLDLKNFYGVGNNGQRELQFYL